MNLQRWLGSRNQRRTLSPRVRFLRRLDIEHLEDRTLPSVQFIADSYREPAHRPETALGAIDLPPVEPFLSVNPSDAAQLVVSSQAGLRVSANGGANFPSGTPFPDAVMPRGDTSTVYDGAG